MKHVLLLFFYLFTLVIMLKTFKFPSVLYGGHIVLDKSPIVLKLPLNLSILTKNGSNANLHYVHQDLNQQELV